MTGILAASRNYFSSNWSVSSIWSLNVMPINFETGRKKRWEFRRRWVKVSMNEDDFFQRSRLCSEMSIKEPFAAISVSTSSMKNRIRFWIRYALPRIPHRRHLKVFPLLSSASMDWPVLQRCFLLPIEPFSTPRSLIPMRSTGRRWMGWPPEHILSFDRFERRTFGIWLKSGILTFFRLLHGFVLSSTWREIVKNYWFARLHIMRLGSIVTAMSFRFDTCDLVSRLSWLSGMFFVLSSLFLDDSNMVPRLPCRRSLSRRWPMLIGQVLGRDTSKREWFSRVFLSRNKHIWEVI